jgi:hypothetical protein
MHVPTNNLLVFWLNGTKPKLPYNRRSVGQSVLVSGHHPGPMTNFSFNSIENIFRHLHPSLSGAPSLTRGRVYNLLVQVLLGPPSALALGSKSRRTWDNFLLSHLRLGSFLSPLTTHRAMVEVFYPASTRETEWGSVVSLIKLWVDPRECPTRHTPYCSNRPAHIPGI